MNPSFRSSMLLSYYKDTFKRMAGHRDTIALTKDQVIIQMHYVVLMYNISLLQFFRITLDA